eukprot:2405433-Rhodomonas_salina.1
MEPLLPGAEHDNVSWAGDEGAQAVAAAIVASERTVLRACYAVSGTEISYAAAGVRYWSSICYYACASITFLDLHACAIGDKGWPTRSILAVSYRPTRSTLAAAYRPTRSTLAAVYKPTRHDRAILIRVGA